MTITNSATGSIPKKVNFDISTKAAPLCSAYLMTEKMVNGLRWFWFRGNVHLHDMFRWNGLFSKHGERYWVDY